MANGEADRNLLFGLIARQNGLIDQGQLVAAFQAWTREKGRPLAEHLVTRGDLDTDDRAAVEALVTRHLKKHGGDPEKSLAAIPAGRSTRESLAHVGDADVEASIALVGSDVTQAGEDADRTATYSVGSATSDGQRFRVLRPHARGGLGAVFVALDGELHREVALKQILDQHADDPVSRQRFLLEAEITGGLEHPGIVPVYGLGAYADGRPYYAMRFIRGDSLKDAIEQFHADEDIKTDAGRRSLELRKLLRRFVDVCNAIEYAHSRGVLHRDIKPGNIIVGKHGETLVVDWGLAEARGSVAVEPSEERPLTPSSASETAETLPGSALGTPAYMSPEQARGDLDHLGPRSDVYSLGATLYCLLTGRPPLEGDVGEVLRAVQKGRFLPPRQLDPTIDRALEAVCRKAMALGPGDRYPTPKALAEDIERWMADEPVSAHREPLPARLARWGRRHRTGVTGVAAALVMAVVALSVGAALIGRQRAEALRQRDLARGNLEQARRVVDEMYTQVADDLVDQKGMDAYQREILEKAVRFYEGVALQQSQAPELRYEAGRARFRVADIRYQFNQPAEAEAAYKQAVAIQGPLAVEYPDRPEYAQAHAGALNSLAILYMSTGRPDQAEASYRQAASIRQKLIEDYPRDVAYRSGLARIENSLGILYSKINRRAEAEEELRKAAAIDRGLIEGWPEDPAIRAHLARVLVNLGSLLDVASRRAEIEAAYGEAMTILEKLVAEHPHSVEYRSERAGSLMSQGALYAATGRPDQAEAANVEAMAIRQRLVEDHPDRVEFALDLGLTYYSMAYMKHWKKDHRAALDWCDRAIQVFEASFRRESQRTDIKQLLGFSYHVRAQALTDLRRAAEALAAWDRAIELAGASDERFLSLQASRALSRAYLGEIQRAVDEVSAVPKTGRDAGVIFYNEACIFALAAAAAAKDEAFPPAERAARAEGHATRALTDLAEAGRAGYFRYPSKVANMRTDRDLDALRSCADFQLLMLDLAFPAEAFAHGE